jgi:hypothetical protein
LRPTADLDLVERLFQGKTAGWMGVDVIEYFDFDIDYDEKYRQQAVETDDRRSRELRGTSDKAETGQGGVGSKQRGGIIRLCPGVAMTTAGIVSDWVSISSSRL